MIKQIQKHKLRKLASAVLVGCLVAQFAVVFAPKIVYADATTIFDSTTKGSVGNAVKDLGTETANIAFGDFAKKIGMSVLIAPLDVLRMLVASIFTAAMNMLNLMLNDAMYQGVFFSPEARQALNAGWGLVRDFVNMFYVLILIFLAIATILRVNKFSDKKLLVSVVLSALLVNFSKPITLFIIDVSNLAMDFFMRNVTAAHLSYSALVADKLSLSDLWSGNSFENTEGALVIVIVEIIFTTILAITFFVLALALLIRMVAFWVLLVLSPLAFFGLALPGTFIGGLYRHWLEKMAYWAFFGPILLFFLWLALVLVDALTSAKINAGIANINVTPVASGQGVNSFAVNFFKNTIPFAATVYFLFYGFDQSKKVAAKAGESAGRLMNKGQDWLNKGLKYSAIAGTGAVGAAGFLGYSAGKDFAAAQKSRLEDTKYGSYLTKEGRKKRSEERKERWAGKSEGFERDKANESYKKMKDAGMTKEEVAKNLTGKNKYAAAGAAKLMAEKGWLSDQEQYHLALAAARNVKGVEGQFANLAKKKNLSSVINHDLEEKARGLGFADIGEFKTRNRAVFNETLSGYTKGKGVADFAEQDKNFFENEHIVGHLSEKYANVSGDVKSAAAKKAADKISDPEKLQKMLEIIG